MAYFSAELLFICLRDAGRPYKTHLWDETAVVFRARDPEHAFERALEIGKSHEVEYRNDRNERVRWALVKIEVIHELGRKIDGKEVASRLRWRKSREAVTYDHSFEPELSDPVISD